MSFERRALWAAGILFLDVFIFFLPILSILMGYIILSRPDWFQVWIKKIYE